MQEVRAEDLRELVEMLEMKAIKSVIGKKLTRLDSIPDALASMGNKLSIGHTVGKTVIELK